MELIDSKILGCQIVICTQREKREAQKLHPDVVVYLHGEITELKGLTPEQVRSIHITKEVLGGHLLFDDGGKKMKPKTLKEMRRKKC